ncbi:hypothetical protein BU251_07095 [Candidatus Velamenicoccus archaeovorus]|uniref:Tetratricopeptide repeat protein n=1 Tax=Velamenicoccus archaeovorus TaxID=1930593 RepID=A0A410P5M7_VELA1|nr:hypothetical protein [Candidatus Velamenicoccus archaeovorus]QAT17496.1 hypothetical protein BU251_07095 [Candidatus Velamenicoccus archaeovorus]
MKSFSRFTVLVGLLAVFLFSAMRLEAADPVVVELHFQNGVKYYKRGLYDRAAEEFEKTLSMEPGHEEAKIYLEKVHLIQKNQTKVEAKASKNAELKQLYQDSRRLYAAHKYQEAIEVCNKILQIKPIDDYASYYREECEIKISQQLKREKKIQDKEKLKAARRQAKIDRANEKKEKAAARKAAREAARRPVDKTDHEAVVQQDLAAYEVEATPRAKPEGEIEKPIDRKMRLRQEKLAEKERRRQEKLEAIAEKKKEKEERLAAKKAAAEERRAAKEAAVKERRAAKEAAVEERRQAKIDARVRKALEKNQGVSGKETAEERRQAKMEAAQQKRARKQAEAAQRRQNAIDHKQDVRVEKALKKESAKQLDQARKDNKELFLKGVDQYGKRKYGEAIATFESLIAAESSTTGSIYSGTARRLMEKAQQRLKGEGKDKQIENNEN